MKQALDPSQKQVVIPLRRSWRSLLPALLPAIVIGLIGLSISPDSRMFYAHLDVPFPGGAIHLALPVFLLLFLILLARPMMLRFDSYSEIRPHHLVSIRGILSLRRLATSIPYEDIRGVKVVQSIWQRAVGCGDMICWSVAAETPEIRIIGIAKIHHHAAEVRQYIDDARTKRGSTDPLSHT